MSKESQDRVNTRMREMIEQIEEGTFDMGSLADSTPLVTDLRRYSSPLPIKQKEIKPRSKPTHIEVEELKASVPREVIDAVYAGLGVSTFTPHGINWLLRKIADSHGVIPDSIKIVTIEPVMKGLYFPTQRVTIEFEYCNATDKGEFIGVDRMLKDYGYDEV